jgi:hypothetical protein
MINPIPNPTIVMAMMAMQEAHIRMMMPMLTSVKEKGAISPMDIAH